MHTFSSIVHKVDINPYVKVPDAIIQNLHKEMNKEAGPIPVTGNLQVKAFATTVVKFRGMWRLYLNTPMRQSANVDVGDKVTVELKLDKKSREVPSPQKFTLALAKNKKAKDAFEKLIPSRQKEILRYLGNLKQEETLDRNIDKVIQFLLGKKVEGLIVATYSGERKKYNNK
jgi:hypothetical protein